jgi:SpoU rRNA methylase family enzyme
MHLVLQPGIYNLTDSIKINNPATIVYGMGLITLVATTGKPCIEVANVDGVRISGILF